MRKLSFILLSVFAAGLIFLSSCGGEDEEVFEIPSITLTTSSYTGFVGETATISGTITAPGGLNVYRITVIVDGVEGTPVEFPRGSTIETEANFSYDYTLVESQVGSSVVVEIEAVDEVNQVGTATFTITTQAAAINEYTTLLFGAQGNAEPGFYDALTNTQYTYANASANSSDVDLAYYWGATNNSTLAAMDDAGLNAVYTAVGLPIEGNFATRNSTRFAATTLTAGDFTAITNEVQLLNSFNFDNATNSNAPQLAEGDVIAFVLDADRGGLSGLIHIAAINDTNGNGTITINVKIQDQ